MNCQQYLSLLLSLVLVHPALQGWPIPDGAGLDGPVNLSLLRARPHMPATALRARVAGRRLRATQSTETGPSAVRQEMPASQTATLLASGETLLTGGRGGSSVVADAYLKAPQSEETSKLTSHLAEPRAFHTASMLPDGRVLLIGGVTEGGSVTPNSEIFDPTTKSFTPFWANLDARAHHTATLLLDGRLLIVGGIDKNETTLDSIEFWDLRTQTAQPFKSSLLVPRQDQVATLQNDGSVRIHGGSSGNGSAPTADELIDPNTETVQIIPANANDSTAIPQQKVVQSLPAEGASAVSTTSATLSVQFSSRARMETVTTATVTLISSNGDSTPIDVVAAESGSLAFITPKSSLQGSTQYTLSVSSVLNKKGSSFAPFQMTFVTAAAPSGETMSPASGSKSELPSEVPGTQTGGQQNGDDPAVTFLQAAPGTTALSGETRTVAGKYLPDVTFNLDCDGKKSSATSDSLGRFLIPTQGAGHCDLEIDGTTAHLDGKDYGRFFPGADLTSGRTNVLSYTVWLTPIDHEHEITIPSPTNGEVVITAPHLKGLELHLPPGTVIRDYNGQVVTRLGMTRIPILRPPFPLPTNVPVPVYFTIQPGGSFVEVGGSRYTNGKGARLIYPNTHRAPAGTPFNFWDYDPDGRGWYSYGTGHVSENRREIEPDPGTVIHRFTGAMVATGNTAPPNGPAPGPSHCPAILAWIGLCSSGAGGSGGSGGGGSSSAGGPNGNPQTGDPVDPATGLFVYRTVDYSLPDVIPYTLQRTYRQGDTVSRAFGVGTSQDLDIFLTGDFNTYQYADLITADGGRIHFTRTSPGTSWTNAAFINNTANTGFFGSTLIWAQDGWFGWELTLKNGTVLYFPEAAGQMNPLLAALAKMKDRYGNALTLTRSNSGTLTKVTTPNGKSISLSYDSNGHVIQAQDNLGRTTLYAYDGGGRLVSVTDPAGSITKYTYDANDQMLTITDPRGNVALTNQYDSQGHVINQSLAGGSQFTFNYTEDVNGNIVQTQVTDAKGIQRTLAFSASGYFSGGQLLSETRAVGKPEQQIFTYSWASSTGLLQSTTDPLNRTTSYTYDANGNVTSTTLLSGTSSAVTASASYSGPFSEVATITDPMSRTVNLGYDASGNLHTVARPLVDTVTNSYNSQGQLTSTSTPTLGSAGVSYSSGLPTTLTDALGHQLSTTADADGMPLSVSSPLGATTTYQYDLDNRLLSTADALHNVTRVTYNANGKSLTLTDAQTGTLTYTYDAANRVLTRQDTLGNIAHFSYDLNGNRSSVTDRKGQTKQFTYDSLNRLTLVTYADQSTTTFAFDAGNRLTQTVDSKAGKTTYSYDLLDRLLSKTNPLGSISYTYNASGQRITMTVSGQPVVNYSYDAAGRLYQVSQGSLVTTIAYDSAGRRSSLTLPNGVVETYTYDAASRLTEIDYANAAGSMGNLTYQYDNAGHRTAVGGSLARTALPIAFSSATYNTGNQLTQKSGSTFAYDTNGNLTSDGVSTYTWNARNQLASISGPAVSAAFNYDAGGSRIATQINTVQQQFQFDGANIIQEFNGVGSVTANLLSGLGLDENYARTDLSGTHSFLTDALNSTVGLSDASGNSSSQYTYDPFGNTTQAGAASTNAFQFTGRQDDGTGLYYMRARYYSPALQRFISQDPIGFRGGINLYAYAAGNPISLIDPSGTDPRSPTGSPQMAMSPGAASGYAFQQMLEQFYGYQRNYDLLQSPSGNALPDFVTDLGYAEAKAGNYVYQTPQMVRMIGGLQPGQTLDLLVGPNTTVSNPLIQAINNTGGSVYQWANGAWTEISPVVDELLAPVEAGELP